MNDLPPTPPAVSDASPAEPARRRPLIALLLAVLLLFLGIALAGGGMIRFTQTLMKDPSLLTPVVCARLVHFGIISISAVGAAIGLLVGHRLGWWAAITASYVGGASFALLPIVRNGIGERGLSRLVWTAIFLLFWWYLQSKNDLPYFGPKTERAWRIHVVLIALSMIVVLGLGIW